MLVSCERDSSTLPDERLLRRRVPVLRLESAQLLRNHTGEQDRPHGLHFPEGDQVHFPQVRCVRFHSEARQLVHTPAQHRERKNLHIHMVLVHATRHDARHFGVV